MKEKRYESAYLFAGPSGTGKTTLGRIFSKAVLCESPSDGNPCCACETCKAFQEESLFEYKELDAASHGGKDDMTRLRDDAAFASVGKKKIILLDECQDISAAGQDALLKQLEECPEHLIYIFCTTDPEKMKGTLRNRCMEFQVSRVDTNLVHGRLKEIADKEGIAYKDDALSAVAAEAQGQVRNALKIMEETSYLGEITLDNFRAVSKNYDADITEMLCGLGVDLPAVLDNCKRISSNISVMQMYSSVLGLLSDTCKLIYGYEDFHETRLKLLQKLKGIHGYAVLEFLDYLLKRDKFVDKIGLQGDIILLHTKFASGKFEPKTHTAPITQPVIPAPPPPEPQVEESTQKEEPMFDGPDPLAGGTGGSDDVPVEEPAPGPEKVVAPSLSFTELSKMSVKERARVLREQRKNQVSTAPEKKEETERVPEEWPLPRDSRNGENSFDDDELPPEEFSKLLVGGRRVGI